MIDVQVLRVQSCIIFCKSGKKITGNSDLSSFKKRLEVAVQIWISDVTDVHAATAALH